MTQPLTELTPAGQVAPEGMPLATGETIKPGRRRLSPYLRRVTMALALLVAVTWSNGIFAIFQADRVQEKARDIQESSQPSAVMLGQIASDLNSLRAIEAMQLLAWDSAVAAFDQREVAALERSIVGSIGAFESLDNSGEEMRLFMRFLDDWYAYSRQFKVNTALRPDRHRSRIAVATLLESRGVYNDANATLKQLIHINVEQSRAAFEQGEAIYRSSALFISLAMAAVTLMIFGVLLFIVWHEAKKR